MAQSTDIQIHDRGDARVHQAGESIWLDVPLSADGTARVTVFLTVQQAADIGRLLAVAGDKVQRIRAINAEPAKVA